MYKKTYLVFAAILTVLLLFGGTAAADDSFGTYSETETSVLQEFVNIIKQMMADPSYDNYIPAAKLNLENKLATAEEILTKNQMSPGTVTQSEIDQTLYNLMGAMHCLYEKGDKTKLITLIDECEVTYADESKFTPESWVAYEQALNDAKDVRDNENAVQPDVDNAYDKLNDSRNNLTQRVDKTALIELIEECQIIVDDKNIYTEESWAAFKDHLEEAITVREYGDATQGEVDAAYDYLKNSLDGLTLKWVPADKSALIELVIECETTYTDENKFTPESWDSYLHSLMIARIIIDDASATQAEVDAAYSNLDNSRPDLKQTPGENKNTGKGSGSGTGQATIVNPVNNSGSIHNETPGNSYSNTLEEQTGEEESPKGVFLFPWLILLVLIIAGVIYYRNYRNSKDE